MLRRAAFFESLATRVKAERVPVRARPPMTVRAVPQRALLVVVLMAMLATMFGVATASSSALSVTAPSQSPLNEQADAATVALLLGYWNGDQGYLADVLNDNSTLTGYWTFAQALDVVLDAVERTQSQQYYGTPPSR